MSIFEGVLKTEHLAGNKRKLLEPIRATTKSVGFVEIPAGEVFDGNSVPKALQWILDDWDDYGLAGVLHDWLYRRGEHPRWVCDNAHFEALVSLGCPLWKAIAARVALAAFGWFSWARARSYDSLWA